MLVDDQLVVRYLNPGAENLFAVSSRKIIGYALHRLLGEPAGLGSALNNVLRDNWSYTGHNSPSPGAGVEPAAPSTAPSRPSSVPRPACCSSSA